jgi:peptide deformylase
MSYRLSSRLPQFLPRISLLKSGEIKLKQLLLYNKETESRLMEPSIPLSKFSHANMADIKNLV